MELIKTKFDNAFIPNTTNSYFKKDNVEVFTYKVGFINWLKLFFTSKIYVVKIDSLHYLTTKRPVNGE